MENNSIFKLTYYVDLNVYKNLCNYCIFNYICRKKLKAKGVLKNVVRGAAKGGGKSQKQKKHHKKRWSLIIERLYIIVSNNFVTGL